MDADAAWTHLAEQRRAFADLLDTLTPEQWATPSLCKGWSVREVTTHMMVGQSGTVGGFLTAMIKARGKFGVANQVLVDRRSSRPTAEIADDFRRLAEHRFHPPTMDWHAPLSDFVVHRLDVVVPLGLDVDLPLDPWPDVLGFIMSRKAQLGFMDAGLPALSYAATDVAWTHPPAGEPGGPEVSGPAEALALALTRRPVRLDELVGAGAVTLAAWARGRPD